MGSTLQLVASISESFGLSGFLIAIVFGPNALSLSAPPATMLAVFALILAPILGVWTYRTRSRQARDLLPELCGCDEARLNSATRDLFERVEQAMFYAVDKAQQQTLGCCGIV